MLDPQEIRQEKIDRAENLKNILSNPVIENLWVELENKYTEAWTKTGPHDYEERERLHSAVTVLKDVEAHFQQILNDADFVVKFKFS